MPRSLFDKELERLQEDLTVMGVMVGERLTDTIQCVKKQDIELARKIAESDDEIDAMEHSIENSCMKLIARQQPIARDLRTIAATLKIVTDVERVGDQCADICALIAQFETISNSPATLHIIKMLEMVREMFEKTLNAYMERDKKAAKEVCDSDDDVDAMFSKIILELSSTMVGSESVNIMKNVDLMFITKYIERMGDHATNIAEWAIYMITGIHPKLNDDMMNLKFDD